MSNEHKYNMIIILRKLYSLINESNICHLISGQHRQHITNLCYLTCISTATIHDKRSPRACKKSSTTSRCSIGRNDCKLFASMPPYFWEGILSHLTITERYQQVLENIKKGFSFFTDWSLSHQRIGKRIAWITWSNVFYSVFRHSVCSLKHWL